MKPEDGMSRRKFLTAVTALAGAAAAGCGGGGGSNSPAIVPAQSVDTTNTTAFFNEMLAAQKTGQLSPAVVQVINAATNDFSAAQITALNNFIQTLNDETAGEAFIKQNLDAKAGVFHLPPDVQAAVDIANQKWVGTLPFNGGLPTVVNNRSYPSGRSEQRPVLPVVAGFVGCTIMGFTYNYATIQFSYACNTQAYYACVAAANTAIGTALAPICAGIVAATTICIAGTAWWTFGLSIGGCIAACAAAAAATLAATVGAYYYSLNACAKYCPSGASGTGQ